MPSVTDELINLFFVEKTTTTECLMVYRVSGVVKNNSAHVEKSGLSECTGTHYISIVCEVLYLSLVLRFCFSVFCFTNSFSSAQKRNRKILL